MSELELEALRTTIATLQEQVVILAKSISWKRKRKNVPKPIRKETMSDTKLFDVLGVNIESGKIRIMATEKNKQDAEAIVKMAVVRRGVKEEFFTFEEQGKYKEGDVLKGTK